MKGFARSVPQLLAGQRGDRRSADRVGRLLGGGGAASDRLAEIPDVRLAPTSDRFANREEVTRLLGGLSERERTVLLAQFGLDGAPVTGEELTRTLGITPTQIRQIERTALAKLRQAGSSGAGLSVLIVPCAGRPQSHFRSTSVHP